MAGATGLEPAASGVTGRRSNQLSYAPEVPSDRGGKSYAGPGYVSSRATAGAPHNQSSSSLVGDEGLEPPTPSV